MKTLYLESSALIAWLFGESSSEKIIGKLESSPQVVSSMLSIMEAQRALTRRKQIRNAPMKNIYVAQGMLEKKSSQWDLMGITPEVLKRAGESFPLEPVRSLDAIHLATALEFSKIFEELAFLTMDERILGNLESLGLTAESL